MDHWKRWFSCENTLFIGIFQPCLITRGYQGFDFHSHVASYWRNQFFLPTTMCIWNSSTLFDHNKSGGGGMKVMSTKTTGCCVAALFNVFDVWCLWKWDYEPQTWSTFLAWIEKQNGQRVISWEYEYCPLFWSEAVLIYLFSDILWDADRYRPTSWRLKFSDAIWLGIKWCILWTGAWDGSGTFI